MATTPVRPDPLPGTEWTARFSKCRCGKVENGYSTRDAKGKWHPSCWACIKPTLTPSPQKKLKKEKVHAETIPDSTLPPA